MYCAGRSDLRGLKKKHKTFSGSSNLERVFHKIKEAKIYDRIILSTDSEEYAELGRKIGFETPFIRDEKLSDAFTPTHPVILDVIDQLMVIGSDIVTCVYPTSILLSPTDLRGSIHSAITSHAKTYIVSVCAFSYPQRAVRKSDAGYFIQ